MTASMATGWDNGICQDYNRKLGQWFANRLGARQQLRGMLEMKKCIVTESIIDWLKDKSLPYSIAQELAELKPIEPMPVSKVREMWASENGLEDCDMCKFDDFEKVYRAIEAHITGGNQ